MTIEVSRNIATSHYRWQIGDEIGECNGTISAGPFRTRQECVESLARCCGEIQAELARIAAPADRGRDR